MVVEKSNNNMDWLMKFQSKMFKVLQAAPIFVELNVDVNKCTIVFPYRNLEHIYTYDFDVSISDNVYNLRQWVVLNWCPKLCIVTKENHVPSPKEISEKINLQKEYGSIDPYSVTEIEHREIFYIEKIVPKTSTVVLSTKDIMGEKHVYDFFYPFSKFLKEYRENWTEEEASKQFFSRAKLLYTTPAKGGNNEKI